MPSQGAKVLCIELIHNKDPLTGKNTTHFLGGSRRLMVIKEDVAPGRPRQGQGSVGHPRLVRRRDPDRRRRHGPRAPSWPTAPGCWKPGPAPSRGGPPRRDAPRPHGRLAGPALAPERDRPRRRDHRQDHRPQGAAARRQDRLQKASLDAADSIVVWLELEARGPQDRHDARPREVVPAAYTAADPASTAPKLGGGGMTIRRLLAVKDVHLVTPVARHPLPRETSTSTSSNPRSRALAPGARHAAPKPVAPPPPRRSRRRRLRPEPVGRPRAQAGRAPDDRRRPTACRS